MKNTEEEIYDLFKSINFHIIKKNFKTFSELGIHPAWHYILDIIKKNPGIKIKDIVILTQREKATITKTIQRLEKRGFVYKEQNTNDGRSFKIFLTKKGINSVKKIKIFNTENKKILTDNLNHKEKKEFLNILKKLENNLKEDGNYENIKDSI